MESLRGHGRKPRINKNTQKKEKGKWKLIKVNKKKNRKRKNIIKEKWKETAGAKLKVNRCQKIINE